MGSNRLQGRHLHVGLAELGAGGISRDHPHRPAPRSAGPGGKEGRRKGAGAAPAGRAPPPSGSHAALPAPEGFGAKEGEAAGEPPAQRTARSSGSGGLTPPQHAPRPGRGEGRPSRLGLPRGCRRLSLPPGASPGSRARPRAAEEADGDPSRSRGEQAPGRRLLRPRASVRAGPAAPTAPCRLPAPAPAAHLPGGRGSPLARPIARMDASRPETPGAG